MFPLDCVDSRFFIPVRILRINEFWAEMLDRVVSEEAAEHIILASDEVVGFSNTGTGAGQVDDLLLSASAREIHDHLLSAAIRRGNTPHTVAR